MREMKVYLAGKMSGLTFEEMNNWRSRLKNILNSIAEYRGYKLNVINPVNFYNFESDRQQSEREVKEYDLAHVLSRDIVIVNLGNKRWN